MYCSKCGAPNADSSRFCESCGEPLMHVQMPEGRHAYVQAPVYAVSERNARPGFRGIGIGGPLSSLYNDRLFMAAVILMTAASVLVIIQLIALMVNGSSVVGVVNVTTSAGSQGAAVVVGIIIGALIAVNVLTILGFWFLYISGRNREKAALEIIGYKLIRIVLIFYIVVCFIGLAACVVSIIAVIVWSAQISTLRIVGSNNSSVASAAFMMPALTAVIVIASIMIVLMTMMYFKAYFQAGRFKKAAQEGRTDVKISMYVAVMTIIMGIVSFLTMFASAAVPAMGAVQVILSLTSASSAILLAVWMINAKNKLNA